MEDWDLEITFNQPFPEAGVELSPSCVVHYKGTNVIPADSTVIFTWSREVKTLGALPAPPGIWAVVGSSRTYVPSEGDVHHKLRLVSFAINHKGVQMSSRVVLITSPVWPLTRLPRSMILTLSGLKRLAKRKISILKNSFKVLSYNVLADIYVKTGRDQYDHCPLENLSWEYRSQNLLTEILSYKADVLCLQEVQSDHFKNFFEPELARFGYLSIYKTRGKELYNGKDSVNDGCATLFLSDKFKLVRNYELEYDKIAMTLINKLKPEKRSQGINRLMKDNVATVVILEENNCHSRICVANTHLRGGKGVSDVRLFQVSNLIRGLQKFDSLGIPVIVCGDLNSPPRSDTHTFLVNGKVGYFRQEKRDVLGISKYLKLNHSMHLANAYSGASNAHQDETLDYILYSENKLKIDGVLDIPFYECSGKKRLLPSPQWSSDHMALVANLRIKSAYSEQNYVELPINPWVELKEEKNLKVRKKTFKKQKKSPVTHLKKGVLDSLSMRDKLGTESQMQKLLVICPGHLAGNNINQQLINSHQVGVTC